MLKVIAKVQPDATRSEFERAVYNAKNRFNGKFDRETKTWTLEVEEADYATLTSSWNLVPVAGQKPQPTFTLDDLIQDAELTTTEDEMPEIEQAAQANAISDTDTEQPEGALLWAKITLGSQLVSGSAGAAHSPIWVGIDESGQVWATTSWAGPAYGPTTSLRTLIEHDEARTDRPFMQGVAAPRHYWHSLPADRQVNGFTGNNSEITAHRTLTEAEVERVLAALDHAGLPTRHPALH